MKSFFTFYFLVVIVAAVGFIMNIVKLVQGGFNLTLWTGLEVARVVGIPIAPLGAVLGWF